MIDSNGKGKGKAVEVDSDDTDPDEGSVGSDQFAQALDSSHDEFVSGAEDEEEDSQYRMRTKE